MRVVFAGSPEAAVPTLSVLAASHHEVVGVITREDSPQGRKRVMTPTPVALAAGELGLPVIRANRLGEEVERSVSALEPDLGVIVAYGGLVREPLLSMPRLGWINLHFSLLPRWRGAAPVQRALIAGDEITGASVFQLVEELDAGDVYGVLTQRIGPHDTAGDLLASLAESGAGLVARVVDGLEAGTARSEPQVGDVTLAPKLSLAHGRVDFARHPALVSAQIRGVTPEPGAFAELDGARLKILEIGGVSADTPLAPGEVAAIDGRILVGTDAAALELRKVQPAGKKPMSAGDWFRGRQGSATRFDVVAHEPGTRA
ncbi:methionyl-tRNA formyltransferase [Salinibacterium sp. SYSU T00001]|uniref:methionyl-tRNA formyltransferase n=1 Tax=Homoserinimonas sedimenticola TaxID=2986805 RepID=UPI00223636BA|nr:methionyl-tRNA formyltransferase [Salinibacterium sedimenticola]MCW4384355.1 methionyl-tRNA formyltransferase [Salinibacterium sedimenticola]